MLLPASALPCPINRRHMAGQFSSGSVRTSIFFIISLMLIILLVCTFGDAVADVSWYTEAPAAAIRISAAAPTVALKAILLI